MVRMTRDLFYEMLSVVSVEFAEDFKLGAQHGHQDQEYAIAQWQDLLDEVDGVDE